MSLSVCDVLFCTIQKRKSCEKSCRSLRATRCMVLRKVTCSLLVSLCCAVQLKVQMLEMQVQIGALSQQAYVASVQKRILLDKALAKVSAALSGARRPLVLSARRRSNTAPPATSRARCATCAASS